jgi:4-hydroxy-tetrahydrodipicolinate synthase
MGKMGDDGSASGRRGVWRGIFAALVTPMKSDGALDLRTLEGLVDRLIREGIHGLVPLGSTGEFYALSPAERERVLRATLGAAAGRVPVVAGANAGATRDVVALSRGAERLGCSGVMLAAPYYSLPTPDELYAHFRAVHGAIGIPIMVYNYPGRTGVDMTPDFIERLAGLKNVRAVKDSTGDGGRMARLLRRGAGRLDIFCGCDTLALTSLLAGAAGWVGGAVNFLPASHARLFAQVAEGRDAEARKLFHDILPTLRLLEGGGKYTQWVKAACGLMGRDCGAPRGPLGPATPAERARLRAALRRCAEGKGGRPA